MKFMKSIALAALAASALTSAANAATVTYNDRATFQSNLSRSFTDTFETNLGYRAPFTIYGNDEISAVVGQTRFESTGFTNFNFLINFQGSTAYCTGCNGSFKLTFDATTFGTANGVAGVGIDVGLNQNFDALVLFGDNSSQLFAIARDTTSFFGLTSDKLIKSISFGPGGGTTTNTSFVFDNLTIGEAGNGVPEPATWAMMIIGFGLVGASARRRRQNVRTVTA